MPITPFLRNHTFDPETKEAMSTAFIQVCTTLGVDDPADQIGALVAERIIELARKGVHTRTAFYLAVLQEYSANPQ